MIPLRDEESNVLPLHAEFTAVLQATGSPVRSDPGRGRQRRSDVCPAAARSRQRDPHVRVIRFTKNFGQTAAFAAGFAAARGALIVTADGDLQNDLADIPQLVRLAGSHDIVCGWRKERRDALPDAPSAIDGRQLAAWPGVRHPAARQRLLAESVSRRGGQAAEAAARACTATCRRIASQLGGRVAEVPVNHRPRRFGRSKYGLSRTFIVVGDLLHLRGR